MKIVEMEVGGHGYNQIEWLIVRRVIHATADFNFARSNKIVFHPNSIQTALKVMNQSPNIVTDSEMTEAGISRRRLGELDGSVHCLINDSQVTDEARRLGVTRARVAMRRSAQLAKDGIIVIGTAPTALLEVIDLIGSGVMKPAVVVGVPVGFVSAEESKQLLSKSEMPFITNVGRKGGSAVAASIVNALMAIVLRE